MIKKALVSVWISVLAGMALFAVSAAFGAELPSGVPPAGLVTPTFSGVITPSVKAPAGKSVTITGGLGAWIGTLVEGSTTTYNMVSIDPSTLSISADGIGGVDIDGVNGGVDIDGGDGGVDITGDVGLGGDLGFNGDNAYINDVNYIVNDKTGTQRGLLLQSGDASIQIEAPVTTGGNAPISINSIDSFGKNNFITLSGNGVSVKTEGSASNISISTLKDLSLSGTNIIATGHLTATSIGTYTFRESSYATLPGGEGGAWYQYFSCNTGEQAVSCYGNAYSSIPVVGNFSSGETNDVYMTGLYPYNGQCEVNYKNTSASTRYIKAGALCYKSGT